MKSLSLVAVLRGKGGLLNTYFAKLTGVKNVHSHFCHFHTGEPYCFHHQFESIHPFYDGNGRTGRIINILFLVKEGLLNIPILYLSRFINQNKSQYYKLLQKVRSENSWEEWILFILEGVEQTSLQAIRVIEGIKELMLGHKLKIRSELPKLYSQDLLNNIFRHPCTKIEL